ncbi:MAG TPA: hypothetical protein V6C97_26930 [Oculatellaceae cyanobacterium]
MAVGDIYRVAIEGSLYSNDVVNVVHYRTNLSIGTVEAEVDALGEAMVNDFLPSYINMLVPAWSAVRIAVRGVTNPSLGVDKFPVGVVGARPDDPEASQVAGLLNLRTGLIGRRNYGKMYLPAIPQTDVNTGVISPDYSADALVMLGEIMTIGATTGGGSFGFQLIVYSRTYASFGIVTTGFVSASPGTQRRRKIGRGS